MCLVTCVPKSNGLVLPYFAFLILSFLNHIVSLFLFLPVIFFLSEFAPPFLFFFLHCYFFPFLMFLSSFVLYAPTALL